MSLIDLRPARFDSPTVRLRQTGCQAVVEKSYDHCPWWLKNTVARVAISRECWALERLAFSGRAPRLIARPNPFTVVQEYVQGTALEHLAPESVDPVLIKQEALSLLADLEQAGLCHGDLGHDHWQDMGRESNLLWTVEGRLVAIDFAAALPYPTRLPGLAPIASALRAHDRLLATKVEYHFPGPETGPSAGLDWPLERWDLLRWLGKL